MAQSCPACGRPNADRATKCLYCTALLDGKPSDVVAREPQASLNVPVSVRHLIILAPQPDTALSEEKIRSFGEAADLSTYEARLALQSKRYRLLRKVDAGEARELSEKIRRLDIPHVELSERDVERIPVERVSWLALGERNLDMGISGGSTLQMSYPEVLLLVRGEIARSRHQEKRLATPRGAISPLTPMMRLHIYSRDARVAAEIEAERFDWSVLGEDQSSSAIVNLKRLEDVILSRSDQAVLDRGFDLEPVVLSRSREGSDVESLLEKGREGVTYDNEVQFRFYARWRYLAERAQSKTYTKR